MSGNNSKKTSKFSFFENIRNYFELKAEELKLSAAEKLSLLVGRIVLMFFVAVFFLAILALILILVYDLLMQWIGIGWVVSLIELGFVGLLLTLVLCFKESLIIRPVANMMVRALYEANDDNDEEED